MNHVCRQLNSNRAGSHALHACADPELLSEGVVREDRNATKNGPPSAHQRYTICCVVVTMEVEVTSLQGMMGILRNSCIRKKDGGEVSYSGCDAKNRNDSY